MNFIDYFGSGAQKITITGSGGLADTEIDEMVKSAEVHADEDRKRKETIEARNRTDSLVYNCEKLLRENRDKIGDTDAAQIESAIEKAKTAIDGSDVDQINAAAEELTQASHKLAEAMYQSASQGEAQTGDATADASQAEDGPEQEDEVIDAEYVDVDDKK